MDIKIFLLDRLQAEEFRDFILPEVLTREESKQYWYFLAVNQRKEPMGMAVVAPYLPEAELVSIGVSPVFLKKGVATELLSYAIEKVKEAGIVGLRVTSALSFFQWDGIHRFFTSNGFVMLEEMNTFKGSLKELKKHPYLSETKDFPQVYSYGQLSDQQKRKLEMEIIQKNLFDPVLLRECDPDSSFLWIEKEVEGLFLLSLLEKEKITNLFTWLGSNSHKKLLSLMQHSLRTALQVYPENTEVIFTCREKTGEKMVQYFLPNTKPVSVLRSYWHPVLEEESHGMNERDTLEIEHNIMDRTEKKIPDESRRGYWEDMKPQPTDDRDLVCRECRYRNADDLMVCQKYSRKPGNIIYGGKCHYFEK